MAVGTSINCAGSVRRTGGVKRRGLASQSTRLSQELGGQGVDGSAVVVALCERHLFGWPLEDVTETLSATIVFENDLARFTQVPSVVTAPSDCYRQVTHRHSLRVPALAEGAPPSWTVGVPERAPPAAQATTHQRRVREHERQHLLRRPLRAMVRNPCMAKRRRQSPFRTHGPPEIPNASRSRC